MPDLPLSDRLSTIDRLNIDAACLGWGQRLRLARGAVDGRLVLTTGFGIEGQVLVHVLAQAGLLHGADAVDIITLDTGRLFPETHDLWRATEQRYGIRIRALYPRHDATEALVARDGIDGFYRSIAARKSCCAVRKVEPLSRALVGAAGWITGLRGSHSAARSRVRFAERQADGLIKLNPLYDASRDDVLTLIRTGNVPYSALEDRGYRSVGCQPCTRATGPDEAERAGRWWWEADPAKECGLHVDASGRLVRAAA